MLSCPLLGKLANILIFDLCAFAQVRHIPSHICFWHASRGIWLCFQIYLNASLCFLFSLYVIKTGEIKISKGCVDAPVTSSDKNSYILNNKLSSLSNCCFRSIKGGRRDIIWLINLSMHLRQRRKRKVSLAEVGALFGGNNKNSMIDRAMF